MSTHSQVFPSTPSTCLPPMNRPVLKDVLPLYTGVSKLYSKTCGILNVMKEVRRRKTEWRVRERARESMKQ